MSEQAAAEEQDFEPELDAPEGEGDGDQGEASSEDDELEIGFEGDEAAPASDGENTGLVAHLRAEIRKRDKQLAEKSVPAPQAVVVGDEPTMEACEYDHERFATEYRAWVSRKEQSAKAEQERKAAWDADLQKVSAQREALKIPAATYDQASASVEGALTPLQAAVLVRAANNPAALIYALSKSPTRLEALAAITDPVKLSAEIGRQERDLKMSTRRTAPEPEKIVRGSAPLSRATDKEYERLEKEADRTGDRTKFIAYKRRLREKAK